MKKKLDFIYVLTVSVICIIFCEGEAGIRRGAENDKSLTLHLFIASGDR